MNTSRYFRRPRHRISSQSRTQSPKIRHATEGTLLCRQSITPSIRLRGQWVEKAGFALRSLVKVVVMPGRLALTVVSLE